jgi:EAL domain-containing protein (putative c-di-GMP-specific phosphodiesterase class I)
VAAVAMHGLDPARIVFEILETEQADEDLLKSILAVYRSAGFQVAIDDFGVGFSSVRLIEALRPDFLKLDMSLIRGIDRDPAKADVASGLLEMAHGLGIRTIIEGIETAGEWAWVRESRADLVQGFFFAAPGNPPPPLSSTAPVA